MTRTVLLHDREVLRNALREHPALHVYELGDLDDLFFPRTCWFARQDDDGHIGPVALLYLPETGGPVVLAFAAAERSSELEALLASLRPALPRRFHLHASPGAARALAPDYALESHCLYRKMALADRSALVGESRDDEGGIVTLGPEDQAELLAFYAAAYPGNAFYPWMLQTRRFVGARVAGKLASVAGVHVFSTSERVAALGNVATLPDHRGHGLGARVTAALCRRLLPDCDTVGLNVRADNAGAIRLYERLGFETVAEFEELDATAA